MRQRSFLILLILTASFISSSAQTKTVTNADLEKFRLRRLQAEKDLEDYYRRLGLTPEEVAKREAIEAKEREDLSFRLRRERLAREQAEAAEQTIVTQRFGIVIPQAREINYSLFYLYANRLYPNSQVWTRPYYSPLRWRATPFEIIYEPGNYSSNIWPPPRVERVQPRRRH